VSTVPFELRQRLENAEFRLKERQQQLVQAERDLANSRADPNLQDLIVSQLNNLERVRGRLEQAENEVNQARTEIQAFQDQGPKTDSAGAIHTEANLANDDAASVQRPSGPPGAIDAQGRIITQPPRTVPSNAEPPDTTERQAQDVDDIAPAPPALIPESGTRPGEFAGRSESGAFVVSTVGSNPGPNDDNVRANNVVQAEITDRFNEKLVPRSNILDRYASYTYSISLYLMPPEGYARLLTDKRKSVEGFQLLIQSGGADIKNRNEFFDLDFYIDNLTMKSYIQGKGTRAPHNVTELNFRIIEPNGISLLPRLYRAVQKYTGGDPGTNKNYAAQHYLMVIRFYGYDANGNRSSPTASSAVGVTDRNAIVEKFIPFRFTGIKFRVANRLTEYECTGVAPQNDLNTGRARGILPFAVQVQGGTLEGLLTGPSTQSSGQSAPAKAGSISNRVYTSGLQEALNEIQTGFASPSPDFIFDKPDRYFFRVIDNALKNAEIQPRGPTDISRTAQPKPTNAAEARDGNKQSVAPNSKFVSGYPGQSIVQFLDLLIRNSTYVYDQEVVNITSEDGKVEQRSASTPAWYHIGLESRPREYDERRGDYAYDFIYTINIYKINELVSDYFPQGRFNGAHKAYQYWFTGQNTQILQYEQDYNYLYYLTVNSAGSVPSGFGKLQEVYKRAFAAQSPESKQQGVANTGEPGANAADFLYSPGDLARVKMTIMGDPDWIQQGSLWAGVEDESVTDRRYVNFLSDGSINYDTQEVLFSVAWNQPADYDLDTGLISIKRAQ